MSIMRKLFFRNLSDEDYKQLLEIHKKETKCLRRKPQFIIGYILSAGLMFYFLFRTFAPFGKWNVPRTSDIVGLIAALLVVWLLLRYVFKASKASICFFLLFFMPFQFFITTQPHTFNIEYFVYSIVTLFAFCFINDALREYFCLRLLEEQKKNQSSDK